MAGPAKPLRRRSNRPRRSRRHQGRAETLGAKQARERLDAWLAEIARSKPRPSPGRRVKPRGKLGELLAAIAEASPYLWDLIRADPDRFLALLEADPDSAFRAADRRRDARRPRRATTPDAMRAPAARQGRGRAADRARRHRRRVAGRARHPRAHRLRRCGARRGGALPAARRRRAGQAQARRPGQRRSRAAAMSCSPWARWARTSSTIRATST